MVGYQQSSPLKTKLRRSVAKGKCYNAAPCKRETLMATIAELADIKGLDYLVVGIATCLLRNEDGKADPILVAEPIPATALESVQRGIKTTFKLVYGGTFTEEVIPCDDFIGRAQAAARTYKAKPHLKLIPAGETCTPEEGAFVLAYSPDIKRVINPVRNVRDSDNVKQHTNTHKALDELV
jgi:hypothetical protein